ncbi:MAG: RNA polymerase sigma factor [Candidatus Zixiibacteriota bacterium]
MTASKQRMEADDAAIVAEIRAGNVDAFRPVVERHSQTLFRLAYRLTGNEHDAEDIVQESLMKAYRDMRRFELRSGIGTWLYRICTNCALDLLRARKRSGTAECRHDDTDQLLDNIPTGDPPPDQAIRDGEIRRHVNAALGTLSSAERAAFVLRHFQQMPIAEISRVMGLRENATKNTIFRAVQKLRGALAPLMSEQL